MRRGYRNWASVTGRAVTASLFALSINGVARAETTFGALSNFDVVNDTGGDCHGFEIELDGISSHEVTYTFGAPYERYGDPEIVDSPDALGNPRTFVRYRSAWNPGSQSFVEATPVAPNPFSATDGHSCYRGGPIGNYETSGCEHFGIGTIGNPTRTVYRWLKADTANPGSLQPHGTNVNIPAPVWNIIPPAVPNQPPVIQAALPAVPPQVFEFGDAQWVKVFVTETEIESELEHLLTDDPAVPQSESETEMEWVLLQPSLNGGENELVNEAQLGNNKKSVTRRYEFYEYLGAYDPENHEAQPIMLPGGIPQADQVGNYVGAQMAAINVNQVLSVLDPQLPNGEPNAIYPSRPLVFGGTEPYTIQLTNGAIPPGMNLDLATGIFYGTPTTVGSYSFALHAVDGAGAAVDGSFTMAVSTDDQCLDDPNKVLPGLCGCGVADDDSDSDSSPDCIDQCDSDATKVEPGSCGCGIADTDANGNGVADCLDTTRADLSIGLVASPGQAKLGKTVKLKLKAKNKGPNTAEVTHVTLSCAGAAFHILSAGLGCAVNGSAVDCAIGNVLKGKSAEREVQLVGDAKGSISCTGGVSSATKDPKAGDNVKVTAVKIK